MPDHPTTLLAELTHRCPLHCPYCSNPLDLIRAEGELRTEDWKRVFTEARELGVLQHAELARFGEDALPVLDAELPLGADQVQRIRAVGAVQRTAVRELREQSSRMVRHHGSAPFAPGRTGSRQRPWSRPPDTARPELRRSRPPCAC